MTVALRLGPRALQEVAYQVVDGSHPSRLRQLQLRLESPYAEREVEMGLGSPHAVVEAEMSLKSPHAVVVAEMARVLVYSVLLEPQSANKASTRVISNGIHTGDMARPSLKAHIRGLLRAPKRAQFMPELS